MLRRLLERLSHGVTFRSRLPARYGRFPILVSPDARLAYWRRDLDAVAPRLLAAVDEFVRPGAVVWDIGANVGVFALAAAARAGTGGFVLAVEADTWLVDLLRRTCRLDCDPRAPIEVLPAAVDAGLGVARFNIARRGREANSLAGAGSAVTGGTREQQRVVSVTLDWLLEAFPAPAVLKIDVEGAEAGVLAGAATLLAQARPVLLCEIAEANADAVTLLLHGLGYTLHDLEAPPASRPAIARAAFNTIAIPR